MAKIEEITALLINEIEEFKNSIEELKKESIKLDQKEFTVDTSQIEDVFSDFNKKLNMNYDLQREQVFEIQEKLSSTLVIPKWMIISFMTFSFILLMSISYNFYQHQSTIEIKEVAYQKGKTQIETHIFSFFDAYPNSYKTYTKWQDEK